MVARTTRSNKHCRAKDPTQCPYHGAVLRMEAAAANNDLDAYFEARLAVEKAETVGWADEEAQEVSNIVEVNENLTTQDLVKAFDVYVGENPSKWGNKYDPLIQNLNNQSYNLGQAGHVQPLELPGVGMIRYYDARWGRENGGSEIWVIFEAGGRLFRINGTYSSYDSDEWYADDVHEVEVTKTIKTKVKSEYNYVPPKGK